jgi:hypothetical protein
MFNLIFEKLTTLKDPPRYIRMFICKKNYAPPLHGHLQQTNNPEVPGPTLLVFLRKFEGKLLYRRELILACCSVFVIL